MNHKFSDNIKVILQNKFDTVIAEEIFSQSQIIQYLNYKTRSANKGSKSRGSFANIYAIYILVEDYLIKGFHEKGDYSSYEGAIYKNLFKRQRELPFGQNLQNHALNNRLNAEFKGLFPILNFQPIERIAESERYWINENLLVVTISGKKYNIAEAILEIVDQYIATKIESFDRFILACQELQKIEHNEDYSEVTSFILSQLEPNVDARLFEIVSFAILKHYYSDTKIYWGYELKLEAMNSEKLILYKTGRTNANDGGIDFVMKPLGRFFQVTETLDFKKYFLDINKLQRYPITFVIKSEDSIENIHKRISKDALKTYTAEAIVKKYLDCIEEIINIPSLVEKFKASIDNGKLLDILGEIILQSKVEFNYADSDDEFIESNDDDNQFLSL